jgi:hypothetical protein
MFAANDWKTFQSCFLTDSFDMGKTCDIFETPCLSCYEYVFEPTLTISDHVVLKSKLMAKLGLFPVERTILET